MGNSIDSRPIARKLQRYTYWPKPSRGLRNLSRSVEENSRQEKVSQEPLPVEADVDPSISRQSNGNYERGVIHSMQEKIDDKFSMKFKEDGKYVLLGTEKKVVEALRKRGPGLVLLHGGPGKGKSTLARNLVLQVRSRGTTQSQSVDLHFCEDFSSQFEGGTSAFQLAIFLKCEPSSDTSGMDQKLLHCLGLDRLYGEQIAKRLGLDSLNEEERDSFEIAKAPGLAEELNETPNTTVRPPGSTFELGMKKQEDVLQRPPGSTFGLSMKKQEDVLRRLLKNEQVLVIFDGMSALTGHREILQRMINLTTGHTGENVINLKFLVTSRLADLCKGLNFTHFTFTSVAMEDISHDFEAAKAILASHFEWSKENLHQKIDKLKGLEPVREIIERTDGNPFALACVAKTFDEDSYTLPEKWKAVNRDLRELLQRCSSTTVHAEEYCSSIWESIENEFGLLNEQQRDFLILIQLCTSKGTSVRKDVVEGLHKQMYSTSKSFMITTWRTLESKAFLKRESHCADSWLVQSLAREFLSNHEEDQQKHMLAKIVSTLPAVMKNDASKGHPRFQEQFQNLYLLLPYNLADDNIMTKIAKSPEAVLAFETLSESTEPNPDLLEHAVRALTFLTNGSENLKVKFTDLFEKMRIVTTKDANA